MNQIGIFVGEHGKWAFLHDIYADLNARYKTVVFQATAYKRPCSVVASIAGPRRAGCVRSCAQVMSLF